MSYRRVFIGRLPNDVREREVDRLASEFGRIADIRVLPGYAFVEFKDSRDAKECVHKLDGDRFGGQRLTVEPARSQSNTSRSNGRGADVYIPGRTGSRGDYKVIVKGLPSRMSWQELKDLMRKAGEVVYADVNADGDGIVEFSKASDMEEALRMFENYEYEGNTLIIKQDRGNRTPAKKDRDRSPRRDSPSRRRSRSPRRKDDDADLGGISSQRK